MSAGDDPHPCKCFQLGMSSALLWVDSVLRYEAEVRDTCTNAQLKREGQEIGRVRSLLRDRVAQVGADLPPPPPDYVRRMGNQVARALAEVDQEMARRADEGRRS